MQKKRSRVIDHQIDVDFLSEAQKNRKKSRVGENKSSYVEKATESTLNK